MTGTLLTAESTQAVSIDGLTPATLLRWHRFRQHRMALVSAVDPDRPMPAMALGGPDDRTVDGAGQQRGSTCSNRFAAASWEHPLGTDELGRDLFLRLLYGGRISLTVGLVTALVAMLRHRHGGRAAIAGYFGGRLDALLMRVTDTVIALPVLAAADRARRASI